MSDQDPFEEIVLDDDFIAGGVKEPTAQERAARLRHIAAANDRLKAAGEISDGTGKPRFHAIRKSAPWIAIGAVIAVTIVVVVLIAR